MNKQEKDSEIILSNLLFLKMRTRNPGGLSAVPRTTHLFTAQLLLAENKNPGWSCLPASRRKAPMPRVSPSWLQYIWEAWGRKQVQPAGFVFSQAKAIYGLPGACFQRRDLGSIEPKVSLPLLLSLIIFGCTKGLNKCLSHKRLPRPQSQKWDSTRERARGASVPTPGFPLPQGSVPVPSPPPHCTSTPPEG